MAYLFDGTNDTLRTTSGGVAGINVAAFSMGAWIYTTNDPSAAEMVLETCTNFSATSSGRKRMGIESPTTSGWRLRYLERYSSTNGLWTSDADFSSGAWHHICVTKPGGATTDDPTLYVDGVSVAFTEDATPLGSRLTGDDSITCGANSGLSNDYDGRAGEFAFWDRVLTADEVAALGSSRLSPLLVPSQLVWYAPAIRELNEWMQGGNASLNIGNDASVIEHPPMVYPSSSHMSFPTGSAPPAPDTLLERYYPRGVHRGLVRGAA